MNNDYSTVGNYWFSIFIELIRSGKSVGEATDASNSFLKQYNANFGGATNVA